MNIFQMGDRKKKTYMNLFNSISASLKCHIFQFSDREADNSHKMLSFIFTENENKKKNII